MKYDSDDALDRALFALPLEEPPADLRASILTATIYRPAPLFKLWELVTLATVAAVLVWLVTLVVMGGGKLFIDSLQAMAAASLRGLPSTTTLAWVALGGGIAIWLSLFTGFQPRVKGATQPNR
ncbi:MAG TPA: hypothetical protein VNF68_14185 [Candidatus Baltobacteraceae bacterium]|nr:hypothetical protein [Candidatus Baltobacteraceae bacterium]